MTTTGSPAPAGTFSALLRARTQTDHDRAERSGYMAQLLDGALSRERYAEMVAQLWFVYRTLEAASDGMRDDRVAGGFVVDELSRLDALEADLEILLGATWSDRIAPLAATEAYCDRLQDVCFTWPGGFVAHHYTRYLGDLSGGQVIGAVVRRVYGLERGPGASFYEFPAIPDRTSFKADYRARLDAAPWNLEEQEQVVEEIAKAYACNVAVLDELGGLPAGAPGS
jgi:heme oxygenase